MKILSTLRALFKPTLSCEDVNRFMVDYLEDRLDPKVRSQFEAHLAKCPNCEPYFEQYKTTINLVKEINDVEPPEEVVEHTLEFLRKHTEE